ncbi:hypothetical protein MMC25_007056 [Agyrium rufum]|nr:hypothetical protein [Agyrium rufum]
MSGRKIIILTGAPIATSLRWNEEDLSDKLLPSFTNVSEDSSGWKQQREHRMFPVPNAPQALPAWRMIPLERRHLPTGLTPLIRPKDTVSAFETPRGVARPHSNRTAVLLNNFEASIASAGNDPSVILEEFYTQSLKLHASARSPECTTDSLSPDQEDESYGLLSPSRQSTNNDSTPFSFSDSSVPLHPLLTSNSKIHTTNLSDLPTASYLHDINPQTLTVNLLVGIISAPPPRRITPAISTFPPKTKTAPTRKPRQSTLIALTAGDETRTGFGINIWLPYRDSEPVQEQLRPGPSKCKREHVAKESAQKATFRTVVESLRPRDVVLFRNVALGSFRGVVYGQSLRGGWTKVDILFRGSGVNEDRSCWNLAAPGGFDGVDERGGGGGGYGGGERQARGKEKGNANPALLAKARRVRLWTVEFVGAGTIDDRAAKRKRKGKSPVPHGGSGHGDMKKMKRDDWRHDQLPEDTQ